MGIPGDILKWITTGSRVNVNEEYSEWKGLINGIPQGSMLSPLLLIFHINGLPDVVSSEIYLFADDTKIFRKIRSIGV